MTATAARTDVATAPGAPTTPSANASRFSGFDGLRALAAIAVVFHHASLYSAQMVVGHLNHQFTQLDVGVAVFFLISGFLLYRPFFERMLRDKPEPPVGGYLLRRAARIFPAYWLALTTIILVGHFTHGHYLGFGTYSIHGNVLTYARYYLLVHVYGNLNEARAALSQAWTLAVEITFYLFLPLFAYALRASGRARSAAARVRLQLVVLAAMYVASTGFRVWCFYGTGRVHEVGQYWLPANLDLFALGMGVAVVSVAIQEGVVSPRTVRFVERWPEVFWVAAIALFYVASTHVNVGLVPGPTPAQSMGRHIVQGVVALLMLLPIAFRGRGTSLVARLVDARPLVYCGVVSYGIYLWHQAFIEQASRAQLKPTFHASMPLLVSYGLSLAIVAASISWFVVERPVVNWAGRRARRSTSQ